MIDDHQIWFSGCRPRKHIVKIFRFITVHAPRQYLVAHNAPSQRMTANQPYALADQAWACQRCFFIFDRIKHDPTSELRTYADLTGEINLTTHQGN